MRFRITFLVLHVNTIISYISQLKQISYISQLKQIVNKISTPTGPPLMDAIPSVNYAIWSETNRLDICIVPSPQNSVCPSVEVYNMEKDKISTGHRDHDRVKCILIVTLTLCVYFLRNWQSWRNLILTTVHPFKLMLLSKL